MSMRASAGAPGVDRRACQAARPPGRRRRARRRRHRTGLPFSGGDTRSCTRPLVIRTAASSAIALKDCPWPLRIWQRLQWQMPASTKGALTSKRTAPHMQPPLSGSSNSAMLQTLASPASRRTLVACPLSRSGP